MSTPEMNNEPRYGQRATPSTPAGAGQAPESQGTPWPQYGSVNGQANQPYGTYPGASAAGASAPTGAPQGAQPNAGQRQQPAAGQPQPAQWNYPSSGPYPGMPAPNQPLPSRVGPILTIIGGIIIALIVAPIAMIVGVVGGLDVLQLAESAQPVSSGSTVTVDSSGSYLVLTQSGDVSGCRLDKDGESISMSFESGTGFYASGLDAGQYTLTCQGSGASDLMGMTGVSMEKMTNAGLSGLAWGTGVGILGIVVSIIGIVWLVKVNGRRRALQPGAYARR